MSSIVAGAMAGLGKGLATAGEIGMRSAAANDLENARSENAVKREQTMTEWRLGRQQKAKTGLINQAMDQEFATAKPTDASTWTPEQQAAVDQAKTLRRGEMERDTSYDIRAGLETGEVSPVQAADYERQRRTDAESQSRWEQEHEEQKRHNRAVEGRGGTKYTDSVKEAYNKKLIERWADPISRKQMTPAEVFYYQNVIEGGMGVQQPGPSAPSEGAIQALRKDRGLAREFDRKYGEGMAAKYLQEAPSSGGQQRTEPETPRREAEKPYTPIPGSRAAEVVAERQARMAARDEAAVDLQSSAAAVLDIQDPIQRAREARKIQQAGSFVMLDAQTKRAIAAAANPPSSQLSQSRARPQGSM